MTTKPRTLFDKIFDAHLVHEAEDGTCLLYIDRHLVHEVTSVENLDQKIDEIVQALLLGGPTAQHESKQLIQMVSHQLVTEDLLLQTAQHIAHVRQGTEAKAGLTAFLNKQSPVWIKTTA